VYFHGHVNRERIFSALQTARLGVFPSYAESFALAPMEAMACGCPTVYTRRASGPELIEQCRDGLLVDPDCPNEITEAVIRLLADDELAKRLGRAGRRRIEESFSIDAMVRQNETFYSSCLSNFSQSRETTVRHRQGFPKNRQLAGG
jgi:glycosyltransferase involved in cell wall biosynthesis